MRRKDNLQTFEDELFSNLWILLIAASFILGILIGGAYYCSNKDTAPLHSKAQDADTFAAKAFIENMYKDLFEPWNLDRFEETTLSKYFTAEAMKKFYYESGYVDDLFLYSTDFLINGDIGDANPDYGDKIISRTIEPMNDGWFLVTNIWDVIQEPVKVYLQVKFLEGGYKVVDIKVNTYDNVITNHKTVDVETIKQRVRKKLSKLIPKDRDK